MSIALLAIAAALTGRDVDTTVHLPRNGAVEIDTRNRDVVVRIGSGDQVIIRGGSGELDGGTLQVDGESRRGHGSGGGAVDITVPSWARVEVNTISGNMTFNGTPASLDAQSVNGFIHVNGGSGTADVETVAGEVTVNDFHGTKLSASTTGSNLTITNSTGEIDAENVNGDVTLRGVRSTHVSASTVNGGIAFEGAFVTDGSYEFESQNRDVTLTVPGDVSARMKISTMNGQLISPDIPATTSGGRARDQMAGGKGKHKGSSNSDDDEHDFTVVYGSGSARVSVDVFNGNVVVRRADRRP
ncbi:MAG TPA: DUF4097 family beta strand repeat-containing protein [Gemmatimonadales bacterium]|jgi:DUF4097 and DUF4098 domain-containing protein YvlB